MRAAVVLAVACAALAGCASGAPEMPWDPARVELLAWQADDPHFAQDHAVEASGLTASGDFLYAVSEKYAAILQISLAEPHRVVAVPVATAAGTEMEGLTWHDGVLYICDEAHAVVFAVSIDETAVAAGEVTAPLPTRELPIVGLDVVGGKVGFEGVAFDVDRQVLYLLLERDGDEASGCEANVFPLRLEGAELHADEPPLVVPLADCNWRLSGLYLWQGRLLAIQSRYPGEEYRLLEIDPLSRGHRLLADITALGRGLPAAGFGNNLEGIAVGADGDLYLVGDNADIPRALHALPPPAGDNTVFLRIPRRDK